MIRRLYLLLACLVAMAACGRKPEVNGEANRSTVAPNEIVFLKSSKLAENASPRLSVPEDCRAHIREVMCLAESVSWDSSAPVTCQDGGADYAAPFETLYDNLPGAFQKMFCSVRIIYVLRQFEATAFAGLVKDANGNAIGAQMGIRKSLLDENLDLSTWASWKEELSFGGIASSYTLTEDLPHIFASTKVPVNEFLYMVVTHEFGHMFDFANNLNKTDDPCTSSTDGDPDPSCHFAAGSWGSLSWETVGRPTASNRFSFRPGLCFYNCGDEPMTRAAVPDLYAGLTKSSFISAYAATNPYDDFAESIAYYLMKKNLNSAYTLDTRQGQTYDMIGRLDSPELAGKKAYIEEFLSRESIVYP